MQVSFAPARLHKALSRVGDNHVARPLLSSKGSRVVLGGEALANGLAQSIVPSASTLFGPRGACLARERGPLFVCDTGHHRLLIWREPPSADQTEADIVIGQPDFSREGRNAKGEIGAATLNMPTGIAASDGVLAVADAWNHRILIWLLLFKLHITPLLRFLLGLSQCAFSLLLKIRRDGSHIDC